MPDYTRTPHRFISKGLSLRYPPDLLPEGYYPILNNVLSKVNGTMEVRRGMTALPRVLITSACPVSQPVSGVPYSYTFAATGGTTPRTWSIVSGSLPTGLTLNPSTGTISGTMT
jgi:hypothetical protein